MGLSCSCDFDKGDVETWWEPGRPQVPQAGTRCCECNAPLPAEPHANIVRMEVFEPDEPRPSHPEDADDFDAMSDEEFDRREALYYEWANRNGWDSDYERCERVSAREYRCERCDGLATSIEALGYCMIGPGDLIEAHGEYVDGQEQGVEIIWKRDRSGVWQPRRMTKRDYAAREVRRRWWNARYFWWHGGWKTWLRRKVLFHAERRVMRALGYEYRTNRSGSGYHWQRREVTKA